MSLSTWFRDYLYIPLGGNRTGNVYVNLLIVFIVTGFWHGASFNFLVWGVWHGMFLIIERAFKINKRIQNKGFIPLQHILTMLIVVVGWVFFRADGLSEALRYLGIMFGMVKPVNVGFTAWYYIDTKLIIALVLATLASLPVGKIKVFKPVLQIKAWKYASAALSLALFFISAIFVVSSTYNPFIYFRF